jgi:hypothetical protein
MSTGKTTLALLLSALLPAGAAWAAGNDTLVYCSEASRSLSTRRSPAPARRSSPARRCCITAWSL